MGDIDVNEKYEYTGAMLGVFTDGAFTDGTYAPHPVAISEKIDSSGFTVNVAVNDLSAIVIGGINGINN